METAADWRAPVAYALLGRVPDGLARTGPADVALLLSDLTRLDADGMAVLRGSLAAGQTLHPHPVPPDVLGVIGPAQLTALVRQAREHLVSPPTGQVGTNRALDAAERRLVADAPPHHRG